MNPNYHVLVYGSPSGYQTNRAQIAVYGPSGSAVASFDAIDPGMFFEADYKDGGVICMHLPSAMFNRIAPKPSEPNVDSLTPTRK